jgi:membrane protein implicated in regulation of membrane protease activity
MNPKSLIKAGVVGTVIAALCCFTPVLVILFGAIGLAAMVGYLDYVLFPALAFFVSLTIYALWRRHQYQENNTYAKD